MKTILSESLFCLIFILCASSYNFAQIHNEAARYWTHEERELLLRKLEESKAHLLKEVKPLPKEPFFYKPDKNSWSVAQIIEHLAVQEEMYYREMFLITNQPPMPQYRDSVQGKDATMLAYAKDPEKGKAAWFLEPIGKFEDKEKLIAYFVRNRDYMIAFVSQTDADLRQHFTYRKYATNTFNIRDLHQLMLTNIAHTERHTEQIRKNVKSYHTMHGRKAESR